METVPGSHGPQADTENWMRPPAHGWTASQVRDLVLPFDWELTDGVVTAVGETPVWHNHVRGGLRTALKSVAEAGRYDVVTSQCVLVDDRNAPAPDVIVFDPHTLDYFDLTCVPVERLALVIEVVSPCSRQHDRVRKPALFATAKVPCYWRVELDRDNKLTVHEHWLNADTRSYIPAPLHPVHQGKLVTELPFPVQIDLDALVGF
ncbi:Uma2 family endonuclease [Streptomyces sp. NPDC001980]|uniref:Uma2 family endonuclease n=1 Tax=Streptomyces sp. NPDC001980 TaxID=3157126 RepID=UPI00331C1B1C